MLLCIKYQFLAFLPFSLKSSFWFYFTQFEWKLVRFLKLFGFYKLAHVLCMLHAQVICRSENYRPSMCKTDDLIKNNYQKNISNYVKWKTFATQTLNSSTLLFILTFSLSGFIDSRFSYSEILLCFEWI